MAFYKDSAPDGAPFGLTQTSEFFSPVKGEIIVGEKAISIISTLRL